MREYFSYLFIILVLLTKMTTLFSQERDWNRNLSIGTSFSYFQDKSHDYGEYIFHEETFRLNGSIRVTKRYHQGIDYLKVYTQSIISNKNDYSLFGTFSQYDLFYLNKKGRFWAEVGYYNGNYCTCGSGDPYLKTSLSYLSLGFGIDYKLYKFLYVNFAFQNKTILNQLRIHKYAYNVALLGLNIVLEGNNK